MDMDKLKSAFKAADLDGNGEIHPNELISILINQGETENNAKAAVHDIMKAVDKDGDFRISWEEFSSHLKK